MTHSRRKFGWIWRLDPTVNHAISNTGIITRMNLILDPYLNSALHRMLNQETLEEEYVQPLPRLTLETRTRLLAQAQDYSHGEGVGRLTSICSRHFTNSITAHRLAMVFLSISPKYGLQMSRELLDFRTKHSDIQPRQDQRW